MNATRPVAAGIAIRASASGRSAATTAPKAISSTTSVIAVGRIEWPVTSRITTQPSQARIAVSGWVALQRPAAPVRCLALAIRPSCAGRNARARDQRPAHHEPTPMTTGHSDQRQLRESSERTVAIAPEPTLPAPT